MADLPLLDNPASDSKLDEYFVLLGDLTRQALEGVISEDIFRLEMRRTTEEYILLLFLLGGGNLSVTGATRAVQEATRTHHNSVDRLTEDIFDQVYSARADAIPGRPVQTAEEGRAKLLNRLTLWVFGLMKMDAVGKMHTTVKLIQGELQEPRFTWFLGATEEHCSTCLPLDGVTKTGSAWRALAAVGIQPQGSGLECQGWRCDCKLRPAE